VLTAAGIAGVAEAGAHQNSLSLAAAALGLVAMLYGLYRLLPAGTGTFRAGVPAAVAFRGVLAGVFVGMEVLVPLSLTVQWHFKPTMAGLPQFFLVHRLVAAAYPNEVMGLLPAAFSVPALLSLVVVLKKIPAANTARMTQLAWFGGVALFFITLIFPIQFDRQWITIGWALEGAALLWLFHRVPHPGLRLTGVGLLIAAFVRLAFNPAVLEYHPRSATPILNWYLYAYGIVTVCLFAGARLLAPPRNLLLRSNAPAILAGLGTVLAFLLLNI